MSPRGRLRRGVAALATVVALAASAACGGSQPQAAPPPGPLRILLVNDDGWNAPGIVALRTALRQAGHRVVEIAPVADRGSAGTSSTTSGELLVQRPTRDPDLWTVSGTPADAVLVALRAVMASEPPALVVAGINSQPSQGLDALGNGTVGAALTAAAIDFPAIAVSTRVRDPRRPTAAEFAPTADFTVRLIATLQERKASGARLVPQRTVLNVNHPGGPDRPSGVIAASSTDYPTVQMNYRYGRDLQRFVPVPTPEPPTGGENDATELAAGKVTLTDLSADPDRAAPPSRAAAAIAPLLSP